MKNNNSLLLKYAGLATQLAIAIGLSLYIGLKLDDWLHFNSPIFVWLLPLLVIASVIFKIVKDTAPKK
jgi:Na+/H+-dicarboxylate symporter